MNNNSITVCIATFNGEDFIIQQIESILNNIGPNDEIIIVDDCSTDRTVEIISDLNDERVKLFINKNNSGEVFSFNRALSLARNNFIFLSDQDDVWQEGRTELMIKKLKLNKSFVLSSNFDWIDKDNNYLDIFYDGVSSRDSFKYFKNIVDIFVGKTNYFGCSMLIFREALNIILPIPRFVESHDLWIALVANILKKNYHIDDKTFLKRLHKNNLTSTISNRNFMKSIWSRIIFLISIVVIFKRRFILKFND
jgi:glycosyltransferase involved in cell wall biosynthesis